MECLTNDHSTSHLRQAILSSAPRSTNTCDGSANGRISRRIRHSEDTGLNWSGLDENVRHLCRRILAGARVSDALCQSAVSSLAPDNYSSLASLFLSPLLQKYSPKVSFLRAVLKQLLKYVPSDFSDDLYECLGDLLAVEEKSFSYRIYVTEDGTRTIAIIKEATAQLSCGTTGLSVWQASCDLANLLYHIGDLPENILELGAGCGLSGIVAAASSTSSTVVLTDLDHNVLKRLNENVDIAKLNDNVRVQHLDWRNFSVNDLNPVSDLIIAADVVYDTSILADLSNVIAECLKAGSEHCQAIVASTLRDPDTLEQFRKALEKRNLEIVEEFRYHHGRFLFDDGAEVSYPSLFPYFSTLDTSTVFYRIRVRASNIL